MGPAHRFHRWLPNGSLAGFLYGGEVCCAVSWHGVLLGVAADIAAALVFMHSVTVNCIHRDLKPANVLLTKSMSAKVADLGHARLREGDMADASLTMDVGTPWYTAPEVLRGEHYCEMVDIYSFGVVLNELLSQRPPYSKEAGSERKHAYHRLAVASRGRRPAVWTSDDRMRRLIVRCFADDPATRPHSTIVEREVLQTRDEAPIFEPPSPGPVLLYSPAAAAAAVSHPTTPAAVLRAPTNLPAGLQDCRHLVVMEVAVDADVVRLWSRKLYHLTGFAAAEMVGKPTNAIVADSEQHTRLRAAVLRAAGTIQAPKTAVCEVTLPVKHEHKRRIGVCFEWFLSTQASDDPAPLSPSPCPHFLVLYFCTKIQVPRPSL